MKNFSAMVAALLLPSVLSVPVKAQAPATKNAPVPLLELYPEIAPFRTGRLKVSPLHEIYYELSGNPKGEPVMVLHGGPGMGTSPQQRRNHDPTKWLIITHDQRGSGKSTPLGELRENTTAKLISDIESLRRHLSLGSIHIAGGSWGSTLGLAYAEAYPKNVRSLMLRGIFTCRKEENDWFYYGDLKRFYPDAYKRFRDAMPHPERLDYPKQIVEVLTGKDAAAKERVMNAWGFLAVRAGVLVVSDEEATKVAASHLGLGSTIIENQYMANGCFLNEGQLLTEARKLADIPTVIVQGRYDMVCPPNTAYELHRAIPGSRLLMIEAAGHGGGDPGIRDGQLRAVRMLEDQLKIGVRTKAP